MYRTVEDGRALLKAAQEIHAERYGAQMFTPGTHLLLEAAGERIGLSPERLRYYDAIQDLEYEGAIEWDESARARGDKRYVITQRGLDGALDRTRGERSKGESPKRKQSGRRR